MPAPVPPAAIVPVLLIVPPPSRMTPEPAPVPVVITVPELTIEAPVLIPVLPMPMELPTTSPLLVIVSCTPADALSAMMPMPELTPMAVTVPVLTTVPYRPFMPVAFEPVAVIRPKFEMLYVPPRLSVEKPKALPPVAVAVMTPLLASVPPAPNSTACASRPIAAAMTVPKFCTFATLAMCKPLPLPSISPAVE